MIQNAIELFIVGISSYFGPCLVYCAPIVFPYIAASRENTAERMKSILVFSFSRFCAHIAMGLLAFTVGKTLLTVFSGYAGEFYLVFGLVIIVFGIMVLMGKRHLWQMFLPRKEEGEEQPKGNKDLIIMGVLMAVFPCVPRLAVLTYIALEAATFRQGLLYSAAFGLGEFLSPVILLGVLVNFLPLIFTRKTRVFFRAVCGIVMIVLGLNFVIKFFY